MVSPAFGPPAVAGAPCGPAPCAALACAGVSGASDGFRSRERATAIMSVRNLGASAASGSLDRTAPVTSCS